jgi:YaiO family outer membrane protein
MNKKLPWVLTLACLFTSFSMTAQGEDWEESIRSAMLKHDLETALMIANTRLAQSPGDWEALGWHARLLSWRGDWAAAEKEYRHILEQFPDDADVLLGLADVLSWQGRYDEIEPILCRSDAAGAATAEILKRRARTLIQLHHPENAKRVYEQLAAIDPEDLEARAGSASGAEGPRYELRVANDTDFFDYTGAANAQTVLLLATWNSRWRTAFASQTFERFGELAEKFGASGTYKITPRDYLIVGSAVGNKQDVISRFEESVEFGHFLEIHRGLMRGLETSMEQRSLWFTKSQVSILHGTAIVYLPREWTWAFSVSGARSHFDGAGSSWTPAGSSKLNFPVQQSLDANLFYAIGNENYALIDQIGQFSAQTYGGGLRVHLTTSQDISGYGAFQQRTQGRIQTSMGFNYGIRF